jgi:hypothetical protein
MILRLRWDPKTSRFTADPCPGIVVNRARSFAWGGVEIDFDVDPAVVKAEEALKDKEQHDATRAERDAREPIKLGKKEKK